jgi:hypothetical protein
MFLQFNNLALEGGSGTLDTDPDTKQKIFWLILKESNLYDEGSSIVCPTVPSENRYRDPAPIPDQTLSAEFKLKNSEQTYSYGSGSAYTFKLTPK